MRTRPYLQATTQSRASEMKLSNEPHAVTAGNSDVSHAYSHSKVAVVVTKVDWEGKGRYG